MNLLYPFFKWVNGSWVSQTINDSIWLFPAIEGVHLVALALLFGAILVLNLRLMGIMMPERPLPQLFTELQPWTLSSLIVILVSGVLLFASEAVKAFHSTPFRIKIVLLIAAVVFHYTVSWKLMLRDDRRFSPAVNKAAGGIAIALWMGVGFAGRAIGFF